MQNKIKEVLTKSKQAMMSNQVVIMFIVLCLFGLFTTGKPVAYTIGEVFTRFGRNSFLVLSLIIPVIAGLGLNFGIVIGAMAAQIAIFWTVYWSFSGLTGLLVCLAICTPLAIIFGYLVGVLYNKTKGSEMITGMILAYFADGLYQFLFLFIIGAVIPVDNPQLIIAGGVGVKNTIDLAKNLKYSIDSINMLTVARLFLSASVLSTIITTLMNKTKLNIEKIVVSIILFALTFIPFVTVFMAKDRLKLSVGIPVICVLLIVASMYQLLSAKVKKETVSMNRTIAKIVSYSIIAGLSLIPSVNKILSIVNIPIATYALVTILCTFNSWLLSTKLGQDMKTVGQSRTVANAAGINVNKTRIIAMCMSTVLASWGQLIYLQNLGTFSTYGAHTMVGQYAIAALLVGGASVQEANNKQAIIGVLLFHTLFTVAPLSASVLFGSALIGEYFRVFICYGVIALSLAMHAWKKVEKSKVR